MNQRPLKIVTVNTSDQGGGAERRAWCLFKGFKRRGVDSWMIVGQKKSTDPHVMALHESPHLDYRLYGLGIYQLYLRWRKSRDNHRGREDFHHPFSRHLLRLTGRRPDLVHCQNLHGGFFDLRTLARLSRRLPVFLTLHDSWTFTGHCAQPFDCERWRTGCGNCPYLSAPPAITRDGTRFNWLRKQRIFSRSQLRVAAPSNWLLQRALKSILAPAIIESRVITPGIDLSFFQPGSQSAARHALGIPQEAAVAVFVANQGCRNPFKDYATLQAAMLRLADQPGSKRIHLYSIGDAAADEHRGRIVIHHIPFVDSSERLANYYRAADVYVHAARSEAFGLSIAEAMACGTPVVATNVGGIPEVFTHERDGFGVPLGDATRMAEAVGKLLDDPDRRREYGRHASEHARRLYDQEKMIDSYLNWFLEHVAHQAKLTPLAAASHERLSKTPTETIRAKQSTDEPTSCSSRGHSLNILPFEPNR